MNDKELFDRIIAIGEKPFLSEVVRSPWHAIIDVPSLNRGVKDKIIQLIDGCAEPDAPPCLVAVAPPGMGKTHLVSWTREQLETQPSVAFVYISPYRLQYGSLEQYLLNSVVDSLFRSYPAQQARVEENIRKVLVACYDRLVTHKDGRRILGIRQSLWQRLYGIFPAIGGKDPDIQKNTLKNALRPAFLERAFDEFCEQNPSHRTEARADADTFRAACFRIFGNQAQKSLVDSWFQGEPLGNVDQKAMGFEQVSWNPAAVKHVIWTLGRLAGQSLCLAFDQMEDTYHSFAQHDDIKKELDRMTNCLGELYPLPNLCFLFFWQMVIWARAAGQMDYHFLRRMQEGYEVQALEKLSLEHARELTKLRMANYVWKRLKREAPAENPCFPLEEEDIVAACKQAVGQVDGFIKKIRERYREILAGPPKPFPKEKASEPKDVSATDTKTVGSAIIAISPSWSYTPGRKRITVTGSGFVEPIAVSFDDKQALQFSCRSSDQIEVVVPEGKAGAAKIKVTTANGECEFDFEYRKFPSPLREHIKRDNMVRQRQLWAKNKNVTGSQREVANRINCTGAHVGNAENGNFAADKVYLDMASLYNCPVENFLHDRFVKQAQ